LLGCIEKRLPASDQHQEVAEIARDAPLQKQSLANSK
jgi:hypothetical protein